MPVDPFVMLEPPAGGLDRLRTRLRRRTRRRGLVVVAAAVGLAWLVQRFPASQPTERPQDAVAVRALLEDVDHPAVIAWGYAEPVPRPHPTAHPGVVRLGPGED